MKTKSFETENIHGKIRIDRAESEGCFLSEGQEDGHEMNGINRDLSKFLPGK